MDKPRTSSTPLILAIFLLLLPVLYVGIYLILVRPGGFGFSMDGSPLGYAARCEFDPPIVEDYRYGGKYADTFFWPLEQIDRTVRPWKWDSLWGLEWQSRTESCVRLLRD